MYYVSVFSQPTRPTTPVMSVPPPKETVCSIAQWVKKEKKASSASVLPSALPCSFHVVLFSQSVKLLSFCLGFVGFFLIYPGSFEGGAGIRASGMGNAWEILYIE